MKDVIDWINSLFPLIGQGGWMMIPIMACSLVALAIILERIWSLAIRTGRIIPRPFVREVEGLLEKGEIEAAIVACRKNDSMMARVLLAGLNQYGAPREVVRESIEDAGRRESYELDRFLDTLGAARAAAGRFEEAIRAAEEALQLARADGNDALTREIEARIEGYRAGRPYADSASDAAQ